MTDQNRGAYAPQTDAPLAFDPRQPRGRGPAPFTLLVSAIILMVLVVGALVIYRHGTRTVGQTPMLVGAPVGDTKAAPPPGEEAASSDQTAGLQVYKTEAAPANEAAAPAPAGPNFASGPEQPTPLPAARPMAPPPAVLAPPAQLRGPTATPHAAPAPRAAPKPVIAQQTLPPPAVAPATPVNDNNYLAGSAFGAHLAAPPHAQTPVAKPAAAPAKPVTHPVTDAQAIQAASSAKPKPAAATPAPAAATPAPAAAPATGGGTLVQIGAFSSDALAAKGWSDTAHVVPGSMAGKTRKVEVATKDGQTFYRTYVGGFANHADAVAFCEALRAKGKSCFVK